MRIIIKCDAHILRAKAGRNRTASTESITRAWIRRYWHTLDLFHTQAIWTLCRHHRCRSNTLNSNEPLRRYIPYMCIFRFFQCDFTHSVVFWIFFVSFLSRILSFALLPRKMAKYIIEYKRILSAFTAYIYWYDKNTHSHARLQQFNGSSNASSDVLV